MYGDIAEMDPFHAMGIPPVLRIETPRDFFHIENPALASYHDIGRSKSSPGVSRLKMKEARKIAGSAPNFGKKAGKKKKKKLKKLVTKVIKKKWNGADPLLHSKNYLYDEEEEDKKLTRTKIYAMSPNPNDWYKFKVVKKKSQKKKLPHVSKKKLKTEQLLELSDDVLSSSRRNVPMLKELFSGDESTPRLNQFYNRLASLEHGMARQLQDHIYKQKQLELSIVTKDQELASKSETISDLKKRVLWLENTLTETQKKFKEYSEAVVEQERKTQEKKHKEKSKALLQQLEEEHQEAMLNIRTELETQLALKVSENENQAKQLQIMIKHGTQAMQEQSEWKEEVERLEQKRLMLSRKEKILKEHEEHQQAIMKRLKRKEMEMDLEITAQVEAQRAVLKAELKAEMEKIQLQQETEKMMQLSPLFQRQDSLLNKTNESVNFQVPKREWKSKKRNIAGEKRLIYISKTLLFDWNDMEEIKKVAEVNNEKFDITSSVVKYGENIIQVLEGPTMELESTFNKIEKDSSHLSVQVLQVDDDIESREFPDNPFLLLDAHTDFGMASPYFATVLVPLFNILIDKCSLMTQYLSPHITKILQVCNPLDLDPEHHSNLTMMHLQISNINKDDIKNPAHLAKTTNEVWASVRDLCEGQEGKLLQYVGQSCLYSFSGTSGAEKAVLAACQVLETVQSSSEYQIRIAINQNDNNIIGNISDNRSLYYTNLGNSLQDVIQIAHCKEMRLHSLLLGQSIRPQIQFSPSLREYNFIQVGTLKLLSTHSNTKLDSFKKFKNRPGTLFSQLMKPKSRPPSRQDSVASLKLDNPDSDDEWKLSLDTSQQEDHWTLDTP